jgi:2-C-methyl-D-erythritol 4-phosphate cytidylyltransferase/2-C-methyl-D-erythritol 2,4-cyclodiphosphate synthase
MTVGVVIVAAGRGERLGGVLPKQFLDLAGRSVLQHSVRAFDGRSDVSEMVVVLPAELVARASELIGPTTTRVSAVAGGRRRQDSVRAGAEALSPAVDVVLVHDAARPFVDGSVVDRVIAAVADTGAAVPAVPARDTVKERDPRTGLVRRTMARQDVWLAQTPQGFRREMLAAVFADGERNVDATDEAALVERAGHAVAIVSGDERNVKITTADDLRVARARLSPAARVGTGYDLHRLAEGRTLVLAGVAIPSDRGPVAHSDGDVVAHAIVDAMLGAAAAGDIGRHFPDTDPRWKGAAGLDLLTRAADLVGAAGWRTASVDATILLERPKLGPHIDDIRAALARALRLDAANVGLKAKTNEGFDAVGRGEAIAAHAVAVLVNGIDA